MTKTEKTPDRLTERAENGPETAKNSRGVSALSIIGCRLKIRRQGS